MKLADIKWALGEVARAAMHPDRCHCPRHKLVYRPADKRGPQPHDGNSGAARLDTAPSDQRGSAS